jgi:hypothetical protein
MLILRFISLKGGWKNLLNVLKFCLRYFVIVNRLYIMLFHVVFKGLPVLKCMDILDSAPIVGAFLKSIPLQIYFVTVAGVFISSLLSKM